MLIPVRRMVSLPDSGRLIVATDLQGNLGDFEAVERVFEEARREQEAFLVLTGDLVHGPEIEGDEWPPHLGSFYRGDSRTVLRRARELRDRHPGHVFYLMGNHEHAHIGGPVVSKFFPNEAERLESLLGLEESASMREWMRNWPFIAVAKSAGLVMLHAAPHAQIECPEDLEALPLEHGTLASELDIEARTVLLSLLWARSTSQERARSFLDAISPAMTVAVYGHDVARGGYAIDTEPLLCISTSFGCFDGDKMYLDWDLSRRAGSAEEVAREGLKLLYPDEAPVHRSPLPDGRGAGAAETSASTALGAPEPPQK